MKKSKIKHTNDYNSKYFEERDHLDLHIAETIQLLMQKHKLKTLIDVGCGTGKLVKFFNDNKFQAVGCELYNEALKLARKINKKNSIWKASAVKLPFKKNSFDIITGISVIEHLTPDESEKFLNEAKRVLKPGGFVFLVTPNYATPFRLLQGKKWFAYSDPTHINFYTPRTLSTSLKKNGFTNIKTTFPIRYGPTFNWEFPPFFGKFPTILKLLLVLLLFSSPLSIIRNSFWMAARKK